MARLWQRRQAVARLTRRVRWRLDPVARAARAAAILDVWGEILPARITNEDLGDFVEDVRRRAETGQRVRVWVGVGTAIIWSGVNTVAYLISTLRKSTTDQNRQIPTSLRAVAILLILGGIIDATYAIEGSLFPDTRGQIERIGPALSGALYILTGLRLWALRPRWRTCALVVCWVGLLANPITAFRLTSQTGPVVVEQFGQTLIDSRKPLLVIVLVLFLLSLWMYRTLTRPDVRALFEVGAGPAVSRP